MSFERVLPVPRPLAAFSALAALVIAAPAHSVPIPSLMAQTPTFATTVVPANVLFVMDNSTSMLSGSLPGSSWVATVESFKSANGCNNSTAVCDFVRVIGPCQESVRNGFWKPIGEVPFHRSPQYNPLFYQGQTNATLKPWSYDGVRFPEADPTAVTARADGFIPSNVPHDPRFAGRNVASTANPISGGNFAYGATGSGVERISDAMGAGALTYNVDGSLRRDFAGNPGSPANQDIFSRPFLQPTVPKVCRVFRNVRIDITPTTCSGTVFNPTQTLVSYTASCSTPDATYPRTVTPPAPRPASGGTCGDTLGGDGVRLVGTVSVTDNYSSSCGSGFAFNNQCCSVEPTVQNPRRFRDCDNSAGSLECCPEARDQMDGPPNCSRLDTRINNTTWGACVAGRYYPVMFDACAGTSGYPARFLSSAYSLPYGAYSDPLDTAGITIAHYYNLRTTSQTLAGESTPRTFLEFSLVELNRRDFGFFGALDAARGFSNWYTYYRTRLFASIGVTAEALSGLTAAAGTDALRIGYGEINHFVGGINPYRVPLWSNLAPLPNDAAYKYTAADVPAVDVPPSGSDAGYIDNQGMIVRGVRPFVEGTDDRRAVFNWLFSLRAVAATPNREAVDSAGRYFSRSDAYGPYADYPGGSGGDGAVAGNQLSCRRNFMLLLTDGEWTRSNFSQSNFALQPLLENRTAVASLAAQDGAASTTVLTARGNLSQPAHTGEGRQAGRTFPPAGSDPQPQFATVTGSPTNTFTDAAYYWWSRDLRPDLSNNVTPRPRAGDIAANESFWQNMSTYVIGLSISAPSDTAANRAAVAAAQSITWPTVNTNVNVVQDSECTGASGCGRRDDTFRGALASRGDFLSANSVTELADSVRTAFSRVVPETGAGTSFAVTGTTVQSGSLVFAPGFTSGIWSGELAAYDASAWLAALMSGGSPPAPLWTASTPSNFSDRLILGRRERRLNNEPAAGLDGLVPIYFNFRGGRTPEMRYSNSDEFAQAFGPTRPGEVSGSGIFTRWENLIYYLRGDRSRETPAGTGRARASVLGPFVNSQPLYSKAPNFGYGPNRVPAAAGSEGAASYAAHLQNNFNHRKAAVYINGNAGMLHAFAADTGVELFAYVPRGAWPALRNYANPGWTFEYSVDGPLVQGDVYIRTNGSSDKSWRTVLVGTTGAGAAASFGGSIFALDVTNPTAAQDGAGRAGVTNANSLWEVVRGRNLTFVNDHVGLIVQPGVIGSALDGNWYYFVGNGYESTNDKARLLAINIETGALTVIGLDNGTGPDEGGDDPNAAQIKDRPNGLGGVTPVYDENRNIVALYAGDRLGNLWKFDLSTATSTTALAAVRGKKLFVAQRTTGSGPTAVTTRQPITAAPWIGDHPDGGRYLIFGTGKLYDSRDRIDNSVQSIYGLQIEDPNKTYSAALTRADLTPLTLSNTTLNGFSLRQLSGIGNIDYTTKYGWYFDLNLVSGERVINAGTTDAGFVQLVSYSPASGGDLCLGGGSSFRYRLQANGTFAVAPFTCANCTNAVIAEAIAPGTVGSLTRLFNEGTGTASTRTITTNQATAILQATTGGGARSSVSAGLGQNRSAIRGGVGDRIISGILRTWRDLPPAAE